MKYIGMPDCGYKKKEKDNKGFWDRWTGCYDRTMSGDWVALAAIVRNFHDCKYVTVCGILNICNGVVSIGNVDGRRYESY